MQQIKTYIEDAIRGFIKDNPDSQFQRGYLNALVTVYTEAGFQNLDKKLIDKAKEL